jgi:hypothetical protein
MSEPKALFWVAFQGNKEIEATYRAARDKNQATIATGRRCLVSGEP